jgi:hypothetical protein
MNVLEVMLCQNFLSCYFQLTSYWLQINLGKTLKNNSGIWETIHRLSFLYGSTRRDVKECKQQICDTHVIIHPAALLSISGLSLPNFIRHAISIHILYVVSPAAFSPCCHQVYFFIHIVGFLIKSYLPLTIILCGSPCSKQFPFKYLCFQRSGKVPTTLLHT